MQPYAKAPDNYLAQRVLSATPDELFIIALEGAQRFLGLTIQAIQKKDLESISKYSNRISSLIEELVGMVDPENGGELAVNLLRLFGWWLRELFPATHAKDIARLERINQQMTEIRLAWSQFTKQRNTGSVLPTAPSTTSFEAGGLLG